MKLLDYILIAVLAVWLILAVAYMIRRRKKGYTCCGNCKGCKLAKKGGSCCGDKGNSGKLS